VSTQSTGHFENAGQRGPATRSKKTCLTAHTLAEAGLTADDIDWIVPHQANFDHQVHGSENGRFPIASFRQYKITAHRRHRFPALSVGVQRGQIKPGNLIVIEAIGGGLAWGVVLRW
jgi:3-oxoacyl-[acyl-carrier-protein] synthase-3